VLSKDEFRLLKIITAWAAGLLVATLFGSHIIEHVPNGGIGAPSAFHQFNYVRSLAQWDGGHYLTIAGQGYTYPSQHAFFPLYPAILKFFNNVFGSVLVPGLIFNFLCFSVAAIIFYRLVRIYWDSTAAFETIIALIIFPTSFFFLVLYTESLFIFLSIATVYLCLKKQFLYAAAFAALASLTRSIGVFLTIIIIIEYLKYIRFSLKKIDIQAISILVAPFGFIAYNFYLFKTYGNAFYYLTAQSDWQRHLQDPFFTISQYIKDLPLLIRPSNDYLDLAVSVIVPLALIFGYKKLPFSWWIYSLAIIVPPLSSATLSGMPRYVLPSFGFFMIWAWFLKSNEMLKYLYYSIGFMLQVILALIFINGHWAA